MSKAIRIGDATNYTEIERDGTVKMVGNATVFDDVVQDAVNIKSTGVGVSVNTTELTVDFLTTADNDDFLYCNVQLPHARKYTSQIYPHLHFFQTENNMPNWAILYRWQVLGAAKTTGWTALKMNTPAITYTSGTIHQLAATASGIAAPVGDGLSDVIQFKIIRDTANQLGLGYAADPFTTTAAVLQFDVHVEKDTIGSRQLYIK